MFVAPAHGSTMSQAKGEARSWQRLDGVDALRGLAILFVLLNHVNMQLLFARVPYTHGVPKQLVSSLVWNGQRGVQIFFAVSGFLITSTTMRRWGSLGAVSLREFYWLRVARIAPLFLLLLAVLSTLHLAHIKDFIVDAQQGGLPRALLAALTFRINLLEARHGYLPGNWDILWSLSVEEAFYLVFPLACKWLGRGKLLSILLCILVVLGPFGRTVLTHGNEVWQEYSYLGATDAIALGCLTAMELARHRLSRTQRQIMLVSGIGLLACILCFSRTYVVWRLYRTGLDMSVIAIGTCLLIAVIAETRDRGPRLLAPLFFIGRRSYEIYLTHMFVVLGAASIFLRFGKPLAWAWPMFALVILLASFLGGFVAHGFSEPMNRWIRRRTGESAWRIGAALRQSREPILSPIRDATR